uniref:Uncharacterized protein n=1 Tax=Oryza barthii TaxID=65489 RepID=A0A0D3GZL4_9ORYZ
MSGENRARGTIILKIPYRIEGEPLEIWKTVRNLRIGVPHLPIKEENQLLECTLTLVHAHIKKY